MSNQFLGEILAVGFNYNPRSWAICAAQLLSIQQNTALFSLFGTYYGGNGVQTFGLPDLRGRYPMNQGNGNGLTPRVMGEIGGSQTTTMLSSNLPQHNHSFSVSTVAAAVPVPTSNTLAQAPAISGTNVNMYGTASPAGVMLPGALSTNGSNNPFSIMQPYLAINYIVALVGIFPSRN